MLKRHTALRDNVVLLRDVDLDDFVLPAPW